jgi:hypothetical protein
VGYCESTVEDGHLCLCVWSRLPLVVLYNSLPPPALLPASISSVPTNTASVPPLLVDANLPCFRANTSTTSCAACLRLQYAPSVSVRLEYLHTSLHCSAIESTRCYLRFIIAGRTSFNQFSASSMFSYLWPAPGDGDGDMRVHMQPDAAVLRSSASRFVRR